MSLDAASPKNVCQWHEIDLQPTARRVRCHLAMRARSFDHLNSLREDRGRYLEANFPVGFEANDQLKLGWELDRQFPRICALEDLVDVICCSAVLISEVAAI